MGAPTTLGHKLRSTAKNYKSEVSDLVTAALSARTKAQKTEALTDLRTTAWWEGRYAILLEFYERGHVAESVLVEYANKMPGRKVSQADVPEPEVATSAPVFTKQEVLVAGFPPLAWAPLGIVTAVVAVLALVFAFGQ